MKILFLSLSIITAVLGVHSCMKPKKAVIVKQDSSLIENVNQNIDSQTIYLSNDTLVNRDDKIRYLKKLMVLRKMVIEK